MDLRIFDKNLNPLGVVDESASLIWTIRYFAVGEIKILAPVTENNKALLAPGNVVTKHDEYVDYTDKDGNAWRRAAEITYLHLLKDETGQEQIEARGSMLGKWFNKRIITPQIQMTGTQGEIVNEIVRRNVGQGAAARRRFPLWEVLPQQIPKGEAVEYSNEALKSLGDEVRDQCQQGKLGFDILVCERKRKYGFYLYAGKNLTSNNEEGNPPCIFSKDYDNVNEQEYEDSIENLRNFGYVRGAADTNNQQMVATVDEGGAAGLELSEVLVDASDISRSADDGSGSTSEIPAATYKKMLEARGATELAAMIENYTFTSAINVRSNLQYKEDFDLGDRVTCIEKRWGITINSRITEITQTYEKGNATIEAVFGESAPTLLDVIKKARNK